MANLSENQLFPYRPIPFYYITTHDMAELTYKKFYADLSDMKAKGYGGVIPFHRPINEKTCQELLQSGSRLWGRSGQSVGNRP